MLLRFDHLKQEPSVDSDSGHTALGVGMKGCKLGTAFVIVLLAHLIF